ncbi:MAG: hypothetical protein R6W96_02415 [Clostridia bacterium]
MTEKVLTDEQMKRKAVKLVVSHIHKKVEDVEEGRIFDKWLSQMEEVLCKEEFHMTEYHEMRRKLNDLIDCIYDVELRYKLRDSWVSMGKALDKKAKHE